MHELSLARDLLNAIERNLAPDDLSVARVSVAAGAATGVVPHSLRFAFRVLAEGTRSERAEVSIRLVPAHSRCEDCGIVFEFHGMIGTCPTCGRLGGELLSGDELVLETIEVVDV